MSNEIKVTATFTYTPNMKHYPEGMSPIEAAKFDLAGPDSSDTIFMLMESGPLVVSAFDTATGEEFTDA